MSWKLKRKAQRTLAEEQGTIRKDWGGKISVALVYPNTYAVGMSNLGFQTIYRHLNAIPDVVCERVFLPDPEDLDEIRRTGAPPFSLESLRPLTDFHMIGFSVTLTIRVEPCISITTSEKSPVPNSAFNDRSAAAAS